ncbi:nickel/cobalt homeostasis protein RcnB, partial [Escherichia coli]|nr:nickel/cobalt homeostasis protein RcnB [Escherichia coli]
DAGSHWTYMARNYVLITDTEGKILKVYDGETFYHR